MLRWMLTVMVLIGLGGTTSLWADENPVNCKISVHTLYFDGTKRVDIEEIRTYSREDCKAQAQNRKITSNEDIESIKVFFAYRDLASLR